MTRSDLKARIQPALEQDFDALFEEFVEETGQRDLAPFLDHLRTFGLIPDDLHAEASALLSAPPGTSALPDEVAEDTIVLRDPHELLAAVDKVRAPSDEPKNAATASVETFELDAHVDTAQPRRTMFRRASDGDLRETGVQELEERRERRRRRHETGEITTPRPRIHDNGRYRFIGTVGEGAMGRIHLAEDSTLHRKVAYKAMSQEIAQQSTLASKFTAEAQITAQLDHPNIVPVYDLEGESAYTMKLIKGRTLEDVVQETKALYKRPGRRIDDEHSLQARLELFLRACDAMSYAHNRGVVHRDLKPENIMVGAFGELYVMDWGIARLMDGPFDDKVTLGQEPEDEGDLIIGTPGYMSPEQADGHNGTLDGRSDQYALGLILFELVAMKPAVTGKAPLKIVMRHQDGEKDPFTHAHGEAIPPEIVAIVHKATAKNVAHRYESVRAMADDIRRFLRGEAVLARPDRPFQALLRWMGRHRELTLAAIFLIFMGSGLLMMTAIVYHQITLGAQRAREQQLSNLITTVARQGSLIDGQFLKYEGLLSVIATMAVDGLTEPPHGQVPVYVAADYGDPERRPPNVVDSKRYGMPVSLDFGTFVIPEAVEPSTVGPTLRQLGDLRTHFKTVLLRSHSEEAAHYTPQRAERALSDVGVPVAWTYVGLENGVYTAFPGHGQFPDNFDHRESPWYELARDAQGPVWGAPSLDQAGVGLVLTCAQALAHDGELLGVAGIDVTFDYLITELLEAPEFKDLENVETFLLDPEGRIAVRSSRKGKEVTGGALRNRTMRMPDFHHPDVVRAVRDKQSGWLQADGPEGMELVVYNRMHSIGWYYVVAGDVDELLSRGS